MGLIETRAHSDGSARLTAISTEPPTALRFGTGVTVGEVGTGVADGSEVDTGVAVGDELADGSGVSEELAAELTSPVASCGTVNPPNATPRKTRLTMNEPITAPTDAIHLM